MARSAASTRTLPACLRRERQGRRRRGAVERLLVHNLPPAAADPLERSESPRLNVELECQVLTRRRQRVLRATFLQRWGVVNVVLAPGLLGQIPLVEHAGVRVAVDDRDDVVGRDGFPEREGFAGGPPEVRRVARPGLPSANDRSRNAGNLKGGASRSDRRVAHGGARRAEAGHAIVHEEHGRRGLVELRQVALEELQRAAITSNLSENGLHITKNSRLLVNLLLRGMPTPADPAAAGAAAAVSRLALARRRAVAHCAGVHPEHGEVHTAPVPGVVQPVRAHAIVRSASCPCSSPALAVAGDHAPADQAALHVRAVPAIVVADALECGIAAGGGLAWVWRGLEVRSVVVPLLCAARVARSRRRGVAACECTK